MGSRRGETSRISISPGATSGTSSPARAPRRTSTVRSGGSTAIELRLREALGLREAPGDLFARPQLPAAEIEAARRDVRMLHDRAEALVASMRASLGDHPNRDHILGDATHLVERSQTFEEFLGRNPSPERIETAYASINDVATCLHTDLSQQPPPAPVLQAWQGFSRTQRTVTQRLALPAPPPVELVAFEPLPPQRPAPEVEEARRHVQALHDRAEALVESMRAGLGNYANRDHVFQDASQLVERTDHFEEFLAQNPSPEHLQAAYGSINDVATCLHTDFSQQPPPAPVLQAWQGFSRTQVSVHTALHLPAPPPVVELAAPPSPGLAEARRVSFALRERAETLVATMRTQLGNHPNRDHVVQDVRQLVERTERFEQVLATNPSPDQIRQAYAPISEVSTCLHGDLTRQPAPQPVMQGWNAFTQAQYLIHESLKLPPPPPTASIILMPQDDAPVAPDRHGRRARPAGRRVPRQLRGDGQRRARGGSLPGGRPAVAAGLARVPRGVPSRLRRRPPRLPVPRGRRLLESPGAPHQPRRQGPDGPQHPGGPPDRRVVPGHPPGARHARRPAGLAGDGLPSRRPLTGRSRDQPAGPRPRRPWRGVRGSGFSAPCATHVPLSGGFRMPASARVPIRLALGIALLAAASPARADEVLQWNEATLNAIRADRTAPPIAARNLAMVHVAIYDAVNAIAPTHEPYHASPQARPDASQPAAATAAAHRVLSAVFPQQRAAFDAQLQASLGAIPEGPAKAEGVRVGQAAADAIVQLRQGDIEIGQAGAPLAAPGVGVWEPTSPGHDALAPRMGEDPALHDAVGRPVPPEGAAQAADRQLRQLLRAGQGARAPGTRPSAPPSRRRSPSSGPTGRARPPRRGTGTSSPRTSPAGRSSAWPRTPAPSPC